MDKHGKILEVVQPTRFSITLLQVFGQWRPIFGQERDEAQIFGGLIWRQACHIRILGFQQDITTFEHCRKPYSPCTFLSLKFSVTYS